MSDKALTLKELKSSLRDTLRKSGVLDTVKAQIRREFIAGLVSPSPLTSSASHSKGNVGLDKALSELPSSVTTAVNGLKRSGNSKTSTTKVRDQVILSAVYHLLQRRNLLHSGSVFSAESGIDSKSLLLSEQEVATTLCLDKIHAISDALGNSQNNNSSIFEIIVDHCSSLGRCGKMEIGSQTEMSPAVGARESLDLHLKALHESFITRLDAEKASPVKTVEEKLIAFQRECEAKFRADLKMQVDHMRETELAKVRHEAAVLAQQNLDTLRVQLENDYQRRILLQSEQDAQKKRELEDQERRWQQTQYDTRQQLQRDIDELRGREQAMTRKMEIESQGLKMLEMRLRETQSLVESREREVLRREREAEVLIKNYQSKAEEKVRSYLQSELTAAARERTSLALDRKRLEDEIASHSVVSEHLSSTRQILLDTQSSLHDKEAEIDNLKKKLSALQQKFEQTLSEADSNANTMREVVGASLAQNNLSSSVSATTSSTTSSPSSLKKDAPVVSQTNQQSDEVAKAELKLMENQITISALQKELTIEKNKNRDIEAKYNKIDKLLQDHKATIASLTSQLRMNNETSARGGASSHKPSTYDLIDSVLKKRNSQPSLSSSSSSGIADYQHQHQHQHYTHNASPLRLLQCIHMLHTHLSIQSTINQSLMLVPHTQASWQQQQQEPMLLTLQCK